MHSNYVRKFAWENYVNVQREWTTCVWLLILILFPWCHKALLADCAIRFKIHTHSIEWEKLSKMQKAAYKSVHGKCYLNGLTEMRPSLNVNNKYSIIIIPISRKDISCGHVKLHIFVRYWIDIIDRKYSI